MANLKSTQINGNMSISGAVKMKNNDYTKVPTGTTAQRPSTPENGMIRYNTDIDSFEGYKVDNFSSIGGLNVPVGTILMYSPGYFTANDNSGFSVEGPLANTVAAVNSVLSDEWRVCDGSEFLDERSPIWNVAGRYLPNLTDDRFIRGSSAAGAVGGSNQKILSTPQLPIHSHTAAINNASGSHSHSVGNTSISYANHGHSTPSLGNRNLTHRHAMLTGAVDDFNFSTAPGQYPVADATGNYRGTFTGYANAPHRHGGAPVGNANASHRHPVSISAANSPHSHTISQVGNAGSGDSINIEPSYITTLYIIKIK